LNNINIVAEQVRVILDETHQVREDALKLSREVIRLSANSIRATHRADWNSACELKAQAKAKMLGAKSIIGDKLEIYFTGYTQDAQKEYAEAELTYAIIRDLELPSHTDLQVEPAAYINGLAEAIGESRRHVLDLFRKGNLERGEKILEIMDDVYYVLITFDYPDAVTQGLRRQTDMVRGVLEKTRSELTLLIRQEKLESSIEKAMGRFGDEV
jgi:translin